MQIALEEFLGRVKAIEVTLDFRDHLISVGQDSPKNLNSSAKALRRAVRRTGLAGLQPSLDGSVLLLAAAFEQFVSDVMNSFVAELPYKVPVYEDLPNAIRSANERLTGEALSQGGSRFDKLDLYRFVENLRNCQAGISPYVLNGEAISLNYRSLNSRTLRDMLTRLGVQDVWKEIGSTRILQMWSGPGGARVARPRATNSLNELIDNRNKIAHRVGSTTLGPDTIRSYLRFERALARSLVKVLSLHADSL